jgi:hypothetical protein
MGIFGSDDGFDAFFSYAHSDNDGYNDFVRKFESRLKGLFTARLNQRIAEFRLEGKLGLHNFDEGDVKFFIDYKGLPANGPLDEELCAAARKSHFLFIFVGPSYLASEYCGEELRYFSERFVANIENALKHTFIIVLSNKANRLASLSRNEIVASYSKGIRENFYERGGDRPLDPSIPNEDGISIENTAFAKKLDRVVDTLVKRYEEKVLSSNGLVQLPGKEEEEEQEQKEEDKEKGERPRIVFGAVTAGLMSYRNALLQAIKGDLGVDMEVVETTELDPVKFKKRIQGARLFIQLFDGNPVALLSRNDPAGGHLAVQQNLVAGAVRILWCRPTDVADGDPKDLADRDFLQKIQASAASGTLADLKQAVIQAWSSELPPSPGVGLASIMVERTDEDDADWMNRVRPLLEAKWRARMRGQMDIWLTDADWEQINKPEFLQRFHGIVIVDRSKPTDAIYDQAYFIQTKLTQRRTPVAQRLFVLPPKKKPTISINKWPAILFRCNDGDKELTVNEAELHEFFDRVRERAAARPPDG